MDGLLLWWEPHREEFASLRFSVAEECFRNAVGAGTAFSSLTTSDELNLSRYIA